MKFTLSWLKEFLDTNASVDNIVDALIKLGIEVESVENHVEKYEKFSIAYIKEANPHPDADKLKVCKVETTKGDLQIVCGAHNAKAGIHVVFAEVGTYIDNLDVTLKQAKIRGVDSYGMMLSEKELGISEEHDGIIELKNAKVGDKVADVLGLNDIVFDISITPNRGDILGVIGIARELAGYGLGTIKEFSYENQKILNADLLYGNAKQDLSIDLQENVSEAFYARIITIDKNVSSPVWLQNRLKMIGLTPRNAVVDITNYMLFSFNQPMHAYDLGKVGDAKELRVRLANKNEANVIALDNTEHELTNIIPLVEVNKQNSCIAGIKGLLNSAIDINTNSILLEAAHFDAKIVAFAKRQLKINTDSAYRFERGIDKQNMENVINIATNMIIDICGGKVEYTAFKNNAKQHKALEVDINAIKQLSGINLPIEDILEILKKLNFDTKVNNTSLIVIPPSYRNDIDVPETVIAEIIRLYDVNNITNETMAHDVSKNTLACSLQFIRQGLVRNLIAKSGSYETLNMSFISELYAKSFGILDEELTLHNPISEELKVMRKSLIPSLLLCANNNIYKNLSNINIFEVASVYNKDTSQEMCAGLLLHGNKETKNWLNPSAIKYDVWDIKSLIFSVIHNLGFDADKLTISQNNLPDYYHTGYSASLSIGKDIIGYFGAINHLLLNDLKIDEGDFYIAELFFNRLPSIKHKLKPAIKISELQAVKREFSFIIDDNITVGEVIRVVKASSKKYIENVDVLDVYKGANIQEGKKSISLQVILQPIVKTFVDNDIKEICNYIISAMVKNFNAILRDK